jgi:hypothetical protein
LRHAAKFRRLCSMPSPAENKVTTVVIEMEPGVVYVKIMDPKPATDRIEFCLRRTIDEWFNAHPQFVIDRAQAVADHGEMQGIHVWYHVNDRQPDPKKPKPQQPPTSFNIEVHPHILTQLAKEHVEAVVEDALGIWRSYEDRQDTLVAIIPRRIAVILDRQANRGAVLPVQEIEHAMDAAMKTGLQTWLKSPQTRFFVMHLPGSWFVSKEIDSKRSKVVDPAFMRTNMTYDNGRRPQE